MRDESFSDLIFQEEEFVDRKTLTDEKPIDVIIPLGVINVFFEKNLFSFYREIPINRLLIGNTGVIKESLDILKKFPRVEILDHSDYISLGYSISNLISKVETEWFVYLHADVYLPDNWYKNMKIHQNKYDWYESDRKLVNLIEIYRPSYIKANRAYSGSQMGRKKAFNNITPKIDDDFLYRNEDIIFHELILKEGFKYGKIKNTYHYHQISDRKGLKKPVFKDIIIQKFPDKEYDIRSYTMQAKGIIKYCQPKPYLIDAVNKALKVLKNHQALNLKEFKEWVKKTNSQWEKYISIKVQEPISSKLFKRIQNLLMPIIIKIYRQLNIKPSNIISENKKTVKIKSIDISKKIMEIDKDKKVLDVGCGNRKVPGAIGIDIADIPGVDIVQDLNKLPWGDFKDETFDIIFMNDILEHLDDSIKVMKECHRLLKPNGKLYIRIVYWNHKYSFSDPTHKHAFSEITFKFFVGEMRPYYMDFQFSDLNIEYIFDPRAIKKFGKNRKKLLKKAYFNCNIIQGMNVTLTK